MRLPFRKLNALGNGDPFLDPFLAQFRLDFWDPFGDPQGAETPGKQSVFTLFGLPKRLISGALLGALFGSLLGPPFGGWASKIWVALRKAWRKIGLLGCC